MEDELMAGWYVVVRERENDNLNISYCDTEEDATKEREAEARKGKLAVIWSEDYYKRELGIE